MACLPWSAQIRSKRITLHICISPGEFNNTILPGKGALDDSLTFTARLSNTTLERTSYQLATTSVRKHKLAQGFKFVSVLEGWASVWNQTRPVFLLRLARVQRRGLWSQDPSRLPGSRSHWPLQDICRSGEGEKTTTLWSVNPSHPLPLIILMGLCQGSKFCAHRVLKELRWLWKTQPWKGTLCFKKRVWAALLIKRHS